MVMPRSCSSGLESRYRILPASLGEMMPLVAMSPSVSDVFPWSYKIRYGDVTVTIPNLQRGRECRSKFPLVEFFILARCV